MFIFIPEFTDLDILHLRTELVVTDSSVTIKMYEADSSYSYPAIVSTTEALTFEITKDATLSPDKEYFFVRKVTTSIKLIIKLLWTFYNAI